MRIVGRLSAKWQTMSQVNAISQPGRWLGVLGAATSAYRRCRSSELTPDGKGSLRSILGRATATARWCFVVWTIRPVILTVKSFLIGVNLARVIGGLWVCRAPRAGSGRGPYRATAAQRTAGGMLVPFGNNAVAKQAAASASKDGDLQPIGAVVSRRENTRPYLRTLSVARVRQRALPRPSSWRTYVVRDSGVCCGSVTAAAITRR
jgi:hypothetical protein